MYRLWHSLRPTPTPTFTRTHTHTPRLACHLPTASHLKLYELLKFEVTVLSSLCWVENCFVEVTAAVLYYLLSALFLSRLLTGIMMSKNFIIYCCNIFFYFSVLWYSLLLLCVRILLKLYVHLLFTYHMHLKLSIRLSPLECCTLSLQRHPLNSFETPLKQFNCMSNTQPPTHTWMRITCSIHTIYKIWQNSILNVYAKSLWAQ